VGMERVMIAQCVSSTKGVRGNKGRNFRQAHFRVKCCKSGQDLMAVRAWILETVQVSTALALDAYDAYDALAS
jgi:hypothetical protein